MDWKLFVSTFGLVFLAELGDKTQLATMALTAGGGSRLPVFLGSSIALVASAGLAVLVGGLISGWLSPTLLRRAAGALFVVMGIVFLVIPPDAGDEAAPEVPEAQPTP